MLMKKYLVILLSVPMLMFCSEESAFMEIKDFFNKKAWSKVISSSPTVLKKYPKSVFVKEVYFFTAVSYFHKNQPDIANQYLSTFLEKEGSSRYFEEALKYKYFIAEKFENGYYGHLFGVAALPRLEPMWDSAYQLYDEVIMTLPRHDLAAMALFRKGSMYLIDEKFDESIETYNAIIRRFPRNALSQQAYIEIAKVYKKQIRSDYLDPKCYEFALINQKNFEQAYPSSKWKVEMEEVITDIIDLFAEDVYKSAMYFDKKQNSDSCIMYLKSIVVKYPKSKFASLAMQKIAAYELEILQDQTERNQSSILIGSE